MARTSNRQGEETYQNRIIQQDPLYERVKHSTVIARKIISSQNNSRSKLRTSLLQLVIPLHLTPHEEMHGIIQFMCVPIALFRLNQFYMGKWCKISLVKDSISWILVLSKSVMEIFHNILSSINCQVKINPGNIQWI